MKVTGTLSREQASPYAFRLVLLQIYSVLQIGHAKLCSHLMFNILCGIDSLVHFIIIANELDIVADDDVIVK